jgi:asparagine synthase (glutamine-hydrolysing)
MCGIFCLIGKFDDSETIVKRGLSALRHRGPDRVSISKNKIDGIECIIAHARLAVVGLGEQGNQPKSDDLNEFAFNGEIYSVGERETLRESNIDSDTQWLWNRAKARLGPLIYYEVEGIWAIALVAKDKKQVTLLRDPLGVIPLYVYEDQRGIIISSEIQAIAKAIGGLKINVDQLIKSVAVRQLSYGLYINGIKAIAPGEERVYDIGKDRVTFCKSSISGLTPGFYCGSSDTFNRTLIAAATKQTQTDVPIGLQMSGGVDSTLLASVLSKQMERSIQPICASIGGLHDEANKVAKSAKHLGLPSPIFVEINKQTFSNELLNSFRRFDPAYSHPNYFGITKVAEAARDNGIKVLLCGEGADEIFRGYSRLLPSNLLRIVSKRISHEVLLRTESYSIKFDWCYANKVDEILIQSAMESFNWVKDDSTRFLMANYMHELLYRQNIACMAKSVESRPVYLDFSLVDYAFERDKSFCSISKKGVFLRKGCLKQELLRNYPEFKIDSVKNGFELPVKQLLSDDLIDILKKSVEFSKRDLGLDRTKWFIKFVNGSLSDYEFERTLWPALLTTGALIATGNNVIDSI